MSDEVKGLRDTCYMHGHKWGECHCDPGNGHHGFEWEGMQITSPVTSDCGRFFVNPVEFYGDAFIEWAVDIAVDKFNDLMIDCAIEADALDQVGWNGLPDDARTEVYKRFWNNIAADCLAQVDMP